MSRAVPFAVLGLLLAVGGVLAWRWLGGAAADPLLAQHLERRGRVALVGDHPGLDIGATGFPGTTLVSASPLADALDSGRGADVVAAMRDADIDALLVASGPRADEEAPLRARLAAYRPVEGLRGVYLTPGWALYAPGVSADLGESADALPRIARAILEGTPPPRIQRFPEPLRRIRNVEVMVLLRDGGRARLWRSARGSSVARALVTAAVVARQRWEERERALGGPLDERLPRLDVEVYLLEEDGTLGATTPAFVDRVFYPGHGVAYARPGAWRYQLPDATARAGEGSAVRAYAALFTDNALPEDSLRRADLRFYRLVSTRLGVSPAPADVEPEDGLGPDALLEAVDMLDAPGPS